MNVTRVLGLAAVGALLVLAAPAERAQALAQVRQHLGVGAHGDEAAHEAAGTGAADECGLKQVRSDRPARGPVFRSAAFSASMILESSFRVDG